MKVRLRRRRLIVVVATGVGLAALVAAFLATTVGSGAVVPATPTPAAADGGGPPVAPPSARPPSGWASELLTAPPGSFRDKVLHWTQASLAYSSAGIDPANGRTVLAEVWARLDASGSVTALHARYTFTDGSFHQEIVRNGSQETVILGPAHSPLRALTSPPAVAPPAGSACHARALPTRPTAAGPDFVAVARLPGAGFQRAPASTAPVLPGAAGVSGLTPLWTYRSSALQQWVTQQRSASGFTSTHELQVDENGRVVVARATVTDQRGRAVSENWEAYSPIQIYAPASVPAAIFALPPDAQGTCHD